MKSRISILLIFVGMSSLTTAQSIDECYHKVFKSLEEMLAFPKQGDFKRAVFLSENAYFGFRLNEYAYQNKIQYLVNQAKGLIQQKNIVVDSLDIYTNLAIYNTLTQPVYSFEDEGIRIRSLFEYDSLDFNGSKHWENMFVTKLLNTSKGNCHSLAYLYQILANELEADAHLALAPNHVYVKHRWKNSNGGWYNTELTNQSFPTDAWLKASGYISLRAIQNGMYLEALDDTQMIAMLLIDLAHGYAKKKGNKEKQSLAFQMNCVELSLKYFPNYINALLMKTEVLEEMYKLSQDRKVLAELGNLCESIAEQGYRQMPSEAYQDWLMGSHKKNKVTPYPYHHTHKKMLSLKAQTPYFNDLNGEVLIGNVIFNLTKRTVTSFHATDEEKQPSSVMGRWLSVDPLDHLYVSMSPYSGMGNNPSFYIDSDGRRIVPAFKSAQNKGYYSTALSTVQESSPIFRRVYNEVHGYSKEIEVSEFNDNDSGFDEDKGKAGYVDTELWGVGLMGTKYTIPQAYLYFNKRTVKLNENVNTFGFRSGTIFEEIFHVAQLESNYDYTMVQMEAEAKITKLFSLYSQSIRNLKIDGESINSLSDADIGAEILIQNPVFGSANYELSFLYDESTGKINATVKEYFDALLNGTEVSDDLEKRFRTEMQKFGKQIDVKYKFKDRDEVEEYDGSTPYFDQLMKEGLGKASLDNSN